MWSFLNVICLLFGLSVAQALAEELTDEEVIRLCEITALKSKERMETIRTWYGVADVEVHAYKSNVDDGIPERIVRSQINFAVDRVNDRRSFVIKTLENRLLDENGNYIEGPLAIYGGLILDDVFYRYTTEDFNAEGTVDSWQERIPGSTRESLLSDRAVSSGSLVIIPGTGPDPASYSLLENFDPMVWFECRPMSVEGRYSTFADMVRINPESRKNHVFEKQGNMFLHRTIPRGTNPGRISSHAIDMSKEFALVSAIQKNYETGKVVYRWAPELKELDGILQPVKIEEITDSGTSLTKITFVDSHINVPIPESNFTLHYLGVRQEDMVYDNRTQTRSRVADTSFPEALYKMQQERPKSRTNYVWLTIGLVMVLLWFFLAYRRWLARRKGG